MREIAAPRSATILSQYRVLAEQGSRWKHFKGEGERLFSEDRSPAAIFRCYAFDKAFAWSGDGRNSNGPHDPGICHGACRSNCPAWFSVAGVKPGYLPGSALCICESEYESGRGEKLYADGRFADYYIQRGRQSYCQPDPLGHTSYFIHYRDREFDL